MAAAPLPPDETERLVTLAGYEILDTPTDPRFDRFVELAATLYDTPMAAVSLIDEDRQWFKAEQGLGRRETPRAQSFCAHAMLAPHEVMVVEDAAADPRFADNPLVTDGPRIRFYAGAPLVSADGQPLGVFCVLGREPRNLSADERQHLAGIAAGVQATLELHRREVELARASTHDSLTGLANRQSFTEALDEAVAGALAGRPCALVALDIDGLRDVNERHGRAAGDAVLRQVAMRLRETVRGCDLVARSDGDGFAVLVTTPIDDAGVAALVRRIAERMAPPFGVERQELSVGVSMGSAFCPLDAIEPGALLRAAEAALAVAKRDNDAPVGANLAGTGSRPRWRQARDAGGAAPEAATDHRRMAEDLLEALRQGGLAMHWQPVFRAADGRLSGHEALLRWQRRGQAVSPAVLVPVAEASGLIARLDTWVLQESCRQARTQSDELEVAVNLSAHWFGGGGDLSALLARALERSGLSARRLVLELTERTLVASPARALEQIAAAQAMGVRVALDDFGTGYSSLAYLQRFPFDVLKLDRAFVAAVTLSARADGVARTIVSLGHALGMVVVAEGVETRAQLDFLRAEGCDRLQGFLLGRPEAEPVQQESAPAQTLFAG